MSRKAIVHIGTEKTGTTTIQNFIAKNQARLQAVGFSTVTCFSTPNNRRLATYAMRLDRHDESHRRLGIVEPEPRLAFRARTQKALSDELAKLPDSVHTVLFSNEHCHSRLTVTDELETLKVLFRCFFDEIKILVYFRRQVDLAVSHYSTILLKDASSRKSVLPEVNESDHYYNYFNLLELWSSVFDGENIISRLFPGNEISGKSVLDDFLEILSLPSLDHFTPVGRMNESMSPVAQEFVRQINELFSHSHQFSGRERYFICQKFANIFKGSGKRPAREEAFKFQEIFSASNERLRAKWFADRDEIFSSDFSMFPQTERLEPFGFSDAMTACLPVIREMYRENLEMQAEIHFRDGLIARQTGNAERALSAFGKALSLNPRHALSMIETAEILESAGRDDEALQYCDRAIRMAPQRPRPHRIRARILGRRSGL